MIISLTNGRLPRRNGHPLGAGSVGPGPARAAIDEILDAEPTGHLGQERGDLAGRGSPNSRNGTIPKTMATEVGDAPLEVRETGRGRSNRGWSRRVPARRGLDYMIISLCAGGMTVRDISHHLARTLGTELSHGTISKITDGALEEVKSVAVAPSGGNLPDHLPRGAGRTGPRRPPDPDPGRAHRRRRGSRRDRARPGESGSRRGPDISGGGITDGTPVVIWDSSRR